MWSQRYPWDLRSSMLEKLIFVLEKLIRIGLIIVKKVSQLTNRDLDVGQPRVVQ